MQEQSVVVLLIEHRNGTNVHVCDSQETAEKQKFAFVREWWPQSMPKDRMMPSDACEAVAAYFDYNADSEHAFILEPQVVLGDAENHPQKVSVLHIDIAALEHIIFVCATRELAFEQCRQYVTDNWPKGIKEPNDPRRAISRYFRYYSTAETGFETRRVFTTQILTDPDFVFAV